MRPRGAFPDPGSTGQLEAGAALGFHTGTAPGEGGVMAQFWFGWWPEGRGQP